MDTILIYAAIMGFVVLAIFRQPAAALGAFLCTYGLEQWAQSTSGFFAERVTLTNYLTVLVLVWALAVRQAKSGTVRPAMPAVGWATLALFAWAALSLAWTPYGGAVGLWKSNLPYLVATIVLMPLVVSDARDLRSGLLLTVTVGSAVLLLLLFDTSWQGRQIVIRDGASIGSVSADNGNPLAVASLGGWVALIALLSNFRGLGRLWQLLRYPIVALGLIVAIKSGSRGQLFALVAAAVLLLPFSRRIRNLPGFAAAAAGIMVVLVLATLVFDVYVGDGSTRWDVENMRETWSSSRLETSKTVLSAWADAGPFAWLAGMGTSASYVSLGAYPHLVMAEVLAELGVIGLALLWVVPVLAFAAFGRHYRRVADDPETRGAISAIAALFLFEVILSFKQGSMLSSVFRLRLRRAARAAVGSAPAVRAGDGARRAAAAALRLRPAGGFEGHAPPPGRRGSLPPAALAGPPPAF